MKAAKIAPPAKTRIYFALLLLAGILVVLFWKSFVPGYVHFSNDGPLAQQNAAYSQLPGALTGSWGDLNGIGGNSGAASPDIAALLHWILGPVGYSKFLAPIAMFILGLGAWTFFRQLKLSPLAAVLGGLAAGLQPAWFSNACWGVASQQIAIGMTYFALALVVSNSPETPALIRWMRLALAGLAVGMNVMEGFDNGAIYSLFIALFVVYRALTSEITWTKIEHLLVWGIFNLALIVALLLIFVLHIGSEIFLAVLLLIVGGFWNCAMVVPYLSAKRLAHSTARVGLIALFAGFIAIQTISVLVGAFITGVSGTGQTAADNPRQWDFATQWSLPKAETLSMFVPGLFGYRMDTPLNATWVGTNYDGGNYWGGVGRDPNIDRFFDKIIQPGDELTINLNTADHPNQSVAAQIGPDENINPPLLGQIKAAGLSGLKLKETIDQAYASQGIQGSVATPPGFMRFSGGGNYEGIVITLIALWAIIQSFRRRDSIFSETQRKLIWFWTAICVWALLMAFGRFGFFDGLPYRWFYELPYASTIRNPTKFISIFTWAFLIIFAYGVHGLSRRYLEVPAGNLKSSVAQLQSWWKNVRGFDRKWTFGCGIIFAASVIAWLVYASEKPALVTYLQAVDLGGDVANGIAAFSIAQAGWFLLFFAAAILLCILIIAGIFAGKRAKAGGILLGILLLADLVRADLPWIVHWDYVQKYQSNPIIDFLREKPYEYRVCEMKFSAAPNLPMYDNYFDGSYGLYSIEWIQQLFPYYNIQSIDYVQSSRMASDMLAFYAALAPTEQENMYLQARNWELSNNRYLLGPMAVQLPGGENVNTLSLLNDGFDPAQKRFRIAQRFDVVPKEGVERIHELEQLTAVTNDNGGCALFEFTGALPRAELYSNWQVCTNNSTTLEQWAKSVQSHVTQEMGDALVQLGTNDLATLYTLASKNFDPQQTVLVSQPMPTAPDATNQNSGTVEFKSYSPKKIILSTQAATPTVLLLNDKYDPHWRVWVDGQSAPLLRANFIMRGVYLPAGAHTVEFYFGLPSKPLYITVAAIGVAVLLSAGLIFAAKRKVPAKK